MRVAVSIWPAQAAEAEAEQLSFPLSAIFSFFMSLRNVTLALV
jgi:hypothetical protein